MQSPLDFEKQTTRNIFAPRNVFGEKTLHENRFYNPGEIREHNSKYRNTSIELSPNLRKQATIDRSYFLFNHTSTVNENAND